MASAAMTVLPAPAGVDGNEFAEKVAGDESQGSEAPVPPRRMGARCSRAAAAASRRRPKGSKGVEVVATPIFDRFDLFAL
jgi:hypothetical protein